MIVVAIIGLLAAIAIPNFVKARTTAQTNACIANLKQIEGAIEQWALEQKKAPSATVTATDISGGSSNFIKAAINTELNCPAGGSYTVVADLMQTQSARAIQRSRLRRLRLTPAARSRRLPPFACGQLRGPVRCRAVSW